MKNGHTGHNSDGQLFCSAHRFPVATSQASTRFCVPGVGIRLRIVFAHWPAAWASSGYAGYGLAGLPFDGTLRGILAVLRRIGLGRWGSKPYIPGECQ